MSSSQLSNPTAPESGGETTTLALLRKIQSDAVDPKAIAVAERQQLVAFLMSDGYSVPEMGQILKVGDRTIERDKKAVRESHAVARDPKQVEQMVGRLVGEAELAVQRIRRAVRDKDTPKAVRVDAEHRCYQIISDLVGCMQRLGYLPTAAQQVQADLTHHVGEVPDFATMHAEVRRLTQICHQAGEEAPQAGPQLWGCPLDPCTGGPNDERHRRSPRQAANGRGRLRSPLDRSPGAVDPRPEESHRRVCRRAWPAARPVLCRRRHQRCEHARPARFSADDPGGPKSGQALRPHRGLRCEALRPHRQRRGRLLPPQRSRFILSGLLTCSLCGNRYQGVTRHKGKKRADGTRVTTRSYGCGGHVTKGNRICQMNPIPQAELESLVISATLDFYKSYRGEGGRHRLAEAVKRHLGSESQEVAGARQRAESEHQQITRSINNLLDNITPANREFVDQRLKELADQRQRLESRLDELDRLAASQVEIKSIAAEAAQFLSGLEFTLRNGLPEERLAALRRCIDRIHVDKPASKVTINLRTIPAGTLNAAEIVQVLLPAPCSA